jgi:hypothetical protein
LIFGQNPQEPSRFRLLLTGLVAEAAGDAAAAAPSVEWAELAAVEARVAKSHMKPINSRVCCMSLSVLLELAERLDLMVEAVPVALEGTLQLPLTTLIPQRQESCVWAAAAAAARVAT